MTKEINSTILIKGGALTASSSITANMVIFNDPAYIVLATIGSILSLVGIIHEMYRLKETHSFGEIVTELFKAFFLGAILTPMYFMLYMHMGGKIIEQLIGLQGLDGIYNSFWFLLSMLTSWYSPIIWQYIISLIFIRGGKNGRK